MKKQPNAYGLYDMLGNVWEWTNDIYGDYERHARLNPTGALEGPYYAVRGGELVFRSELCSCSISRL